MSSKQRDQKRDLSQRQAIWDRYGDRVVRSGRLTPLVDYTRFYCFECGNHFLQRAVELAYRCSTPRCKCPPHTSQRFVAKSNPKTKGHMCLPEWDQWELEKPDRPTCRPE